MNKVMLVGRLARDVEIRYRADIPGDCVTRFSLAVDYTRKEKEKITEFIPCVAWNNTAIALSRYVKKGDKVAVTGHLKPNNYEKNGVKVYSMDVIVEQVDFMGGKGKEEKTAEGEPDGDFTSIPTPEDLPY